MPNRGRVPKQCWVPKFEYLTHSTEWLDSTCSIEKFDYLNVDVEGAELNVIKGINFKKYFPKLISIENNNLLISDYMQSEIYKILSNNDYVFVNKIGVTNLFIRKDLSKKFLDLIKI